MKKRKRREGPQAKEEEKCQSEGEKLLHLAAMKKIQEEEHDPDAHEAEAHRGREKDRQ